MWARGSFGILALMLVAVLLIAACAAPTTAPAPPTITTPKPAPTSAPATTPTPATTAKPAPTTGPQYGGILKRHVQTGPSSAIGWPVEGATTSTDAVNQICLERLLIEAGDGTYKPSLATEYKVAADKKSVTLTLRKGVKFHDGSDLNAKVVKFTLDAYIAAKHSNAATWSSIDAIDDSTVRVNLKEYRNTMMANLAGILIVSQASFTKNGLEWVRANPVGTGPFKFVSFQRDVSMKFEKFTDYWDKGKPYLDGIETVYIQDPMTAQMAFKSGQVHTFQCESSATSAELRAQGYVYGTQLPQCAGTLTLMPDSVNADSPLANKLVRQAIEYSIDREAIAKATGFGLVTPLYQIAPPAAKIAYIPDLPARKFDPLMAKKLLADAGYPNGFKTKIYCDPRTTTRDAMVAVQAYLATSGIQVDLDFPEAAKYNEYRYNGWKGGMMCQLLSNFATYTNYYSFYWGGSQFTSVKFPEGFKQQSQDVLTTVEMDKDKIQKINRLIYDDSTIIPLSVNVVSWFWTKALHDTGIFTAHHSYWSPSTAWIEKGVAIK